MINLFGLKSKETESNFQTLETMLDTIALTALMVSEKNIKDGKQKSEQSCAIAQALYEYFGADCCPRVKPKYDGTGHWYAEVSDLKERLRYSFEPELHNEKNGFSFSPKEFDHIIDKNKMKPGIIFIGNVTARQMPKKRPGSNTKRVIYPPSPRTPPPPRSFAIQEKPKSKAYKIKIENLIASF